jgi:CRISPR-associated protein Csx17
MPDHLELYGCRHDILGHYLKAIGLLRVLGKCADEARCDSDAEGWWDNEKACFCLRSSKYPTREKLVEFFEQHYQPTPFFSAWNTGGGMNDKQEAVISFTKLTKNRKGETKPAKPRENDVRNLVSFLFKYRVQLRKGGFDSRKLARKVREKLPSKGEISVADNGQLPSGSLPAHKDVFFEVRQKTSGKKAVMAVLAKNPRNSSDLNAALGLGRSFFERFQEDGADERTLLEELRDAAPSASAEAFDAVFTTRVSERTHDSPLFLNRGDAGNGEIFRAFWVSLLDARDDFASSVAHGLFGDSLVSAPAKDGKGTPFFPDAIKAYNIGSGWVTESYPFNALDYVLAVEGGFAMRGSVGRTLAANSRRFAAFPFVFDSGEELVDDANEVKGTSSALWFPLWDRAVTFVELSSFITDAQARLPGKEARFSAEFMRALHSQGVDAGFTGWQEFRFKMKISRVP